MNNLMRLLFFATCLCVAMMISPIQVSGVEQIRFARQTFILTTQAGVPNAYFTNSAVISPDGRTVIATANEIDYEKMGNSTLFNPPIKNSAQYIWHLPIPSDKEELAYPQPQQIDLDNFPFGPDMEFSPDGHYLAVRTHDHVQLRQIPTLDIIKAIPVQNEMREIMTEPFEEIAWSINGQYLAFLDGYDVGILEIATNEVRRLSLVAPFERIIALETGWFMSIKSPSLENENYSNAVGFVVCGLNLDSCAEYMNIGTPFDIDVSSKGDVFTEDGSLFAAKDRVLKLWRSVDKLGNYKITQLEATKFSPRLWSPNSQLLLAYVESNGYEILSYDSLLLLNRLAESNYTPIWLPDNHHLVGIYPYLPDGLKWNLYEVGKEEPIDKLDLKFDDINTVIGETDIWNRQRVNSAGDRLLYTFPYGLVVTTIIKY